jgi:glycosyltransferase involved in cell wall biosynthesis
MSKNSKVAIDLRDLKKGKTGTLTYLKSLCIVFDELNQKNGVEYVYIHYPFRVFDGTNKLGKLLEHVLFTLWKQVVLPIYCLVKGVDVLFCTDYFLPLLPIPTKKVVVFHDTFFFEHPQNYNPIWLKTFHWFALNALNNKTQIIVPSIYVQERLGMFLPQRKDQITVVYEAAKKMQIHQDAAFESWKVSFEYEIGQEPFILYVGTLDHRKNLVRLVNAFDAVHKKHPGIKLVIAGDSPKYKYGNGKQDLIDAIELLQLKQSVLLIGRVNDIQLQYLYEHAFFYAFPSIDEGFGLPIIEAMEKGLPVMAANNTALPEIGGNAAIYFSPFNVQEITDAMENLIANDSLRAELKFNALQRSKLFSWEKAGKEIELIFKQICQNN